MTTRLIPASTIVDLQVDLRCLDVPCPNLNTVLDAVIAKVCSINTELPSLDFLCFNKEATTLQGFYQNIIEEICFIKDSMPTAPTLPSYEYCSFELLDCNAPCLEVSNPCGEITQEDVIQALITRSNTLFNVVCDQQSIISTLDSRIKDLESQVQVLQGCCQ